VPAWNKSKAVLHRLRQHAAQHLVPADEVMIERRCGMQGNDREQDIGGKPVELDQRLGKSVILLNNRRQPEKEKEIDLIAMGIGVQKPKHRLDHQQGIKMV
jgi:hypothetical protein